MQAKKSVLRKAMMMACVRTCVQLFATPWAVARQAPLSTEFSRQEYWSGLLCPPPGVFPTQGLDWHLLHLQHLQAGFLFVSEPPARNQEKPPWHCGNLY